MPFSPNINDVCRESWTSAASNKKSTKRPIDRKDSRVTSVNYLDDPSYRELGWCNSCQGEPKNPGFKAKVVNGTNLSGWILDFQIFREFDSKYLQQFSSTSSSWVSSLERFSARPAENHLSCSHRSQAQNSPARQCLVRGAKMLLKAEQPLLRGSALLQLIQQIPTPNFLQFPGHFVGNSWVQSWCTKDQNTIHVGLEDTACPTGQSSLAEYPA